MQSLFQRKFNCQITGHSSLTFFEAIESEVRGPSPLPSSLPQSESILTIMII